MSARTSARPPAAGQVTGIIRSDEAPSPQAFDAPGGLLVDFSTDLGPNCQPLHKVTQGTTVEATVEVKNLSAGRGGRARAVIGGSGGTAIILVPAPSYARLADVLVDGARVKARGTVTRVLDMNVIEVWAAREVSGR
ncbi:hypothetical protein [Streptomyces mirabilis]|uniref:hypothetical protein n=1 Tax=Streptomyces mirabilis TaxID=68239 RepID=UPI0033C1D732